MRLCAIQCLFILRHLLSWNMILEHVFGIHRTLLFVIIYIYHETILGWSKIICNVNASRRLIGRLCLWLFHTTRVYNSARLNNYYRLAAFTSRPLTLAVSARFYKSLEICGSVRVVVRGCCTRKTQTADKHANINPAAMHIVAVCG